VGGDVAAVTGRVANEVGVPTEDLLRIPIVMIGSVNQIVEELHARRERWDMSYFVVMADKADEFAPVVAALASR
jgi:hypothetical protein